MKISLHLAYWGLGTAVHFAPKKVPSCLPLAQAQLPGTILRGELVGGHLITENPTSIQPGPSLTTTREGAPSTYSCFAGEETEAQGRGTPLSEGVGTKMWAPDVAL